MGVIDGCNVVRAPPRTKPADVAYLFQALVKHDVKEVKMFLNDDNCCVRRSGKSHTSLNLLSFKRHFNNREDHVTAMRDLLKEYVFILAETEAADMVTECETDGGGVCWLHTDLCSPHIVRHLARLRPQCLDHRCARDRLTPLQYHIQSGRLDVIRELVVNGANASLNVSCKFTFSSTQEWEFYSVPLVVRLLDSCEEMLVECFAHAMKRQGPDHAFSVLYPDTSLIFGTGYCQSLFLEDLQRTLEAFHEKGKVSFGMEQLQFYRYFTPLAESVLFLVVMEPRLFNDLPGMESDLLNNDYVRMVRNLFEQFNPRSPSNSPAAYVTLFERLPRFMVEAAFVEWIRSENEEWFSMDAAHLACLVLSKSVNPDMIIVGDGIKRRSLIDLCYDTHNYDAALLCYYAGGHFYRDTSSGDGPLKDHNMGFTKEESPGRKQIQKGCKMLLLEYSHSPRPLRDVAALTIRRMITISEMEGSPYTTDFWMDIPLLETREVKLEVSVIFGRQCKQLLRDIQSSKSRYVPRPSVVLERHERRIEFDMDKMTLYSEDPVDFRNISADEIEEAEQASSPENYRMDAVTHQSEIRTDYQPTELTTNQGATIKTGGSLVSETEFTTLVKGNARKSGASMELLTEPDDRVSSLNLGTVKSENLEEDEDTATQIRTGKDAPNVQIEDAAAAPVISVEQEIAPYETEYQAEYRDPASRRRRSEDDIERVRSRSRQLEREMVLGEDTDPRAPPVGYHHEGADAPADHIVISKEHGELGEPSTGGYYDGESLVVEDLQVGNKHRQSQAAHVGGINTGESDEEEEEDTETGKVTTAKWLKLKK